MLTLLVFCCLLTRRAPLCESGILRTYDEKVTSVEKKLAKFTFPFGGVHCLKRILGTASKAFYIAGLPFCFVCFSLYVMAVVACANTLEQGLLFFVLPLRKTISRVISFQTRTMTKKPTCRTRKAAAAGSPRLAQKAVRKVLQSIKHGAMLGQHAHHGARRCRHIRQFVCRE